MEIATGAANAVSGAGLLHAGLVPGRPGAHLLESARRGNRRTRATAGPSSGWRTRTVGTAGSSTARTAGTSTAGYVSPDGKYVVFTGNMQEDGDPGQLGRAHGPDAPGRCADHRRREPGAAQASSGGEERSRAGPSRRMGAVLDVGRDRLRAGGRPGPTASYRRGRRSPRQTALAAELKPKGWIAFSALDRAGRLGPLPDASRRHPTGAPLTRTARHPRGRRSVLARRQEDPLLPDPQDRGRRQQHLRDVRPGDRRCRRPERRDSRPRFPLGLVGARTGTQLACLDRSGIRIIDVASGKDSGRLPRKGIVQQLVWSPDGHVVRGHGQRAGPLLEHRPAGREDRARSIAVSETERYNCTPDWMPDSRSILYSRGIVPETGGLCRDLAGQHRRQGQEDALRRRRASTSTAAAPRPTASTCSSPAAKSTWPGGQFANRPWPSSGWPTPPWSAGRRRRSRQQYPDARRGTDARPLVGAGSRTGPTPSTGPACACRTLNGSGWNDRSPTHPRDA